MENPEDEIDLKIILDEVKNEVNILDKNRDEIQERLEYLSKKEEWFEAILEVEKEHKDKLENLTEKQWMDLVHKFVDKIFVEEDVIRIVMRVGKRQ